MASLGPVEARIPFLLGCLGMAFAVYWAFCVEGRFRTESWFTLTSREILILGIFLRLCLLPMPPCDDIYRYLWEGKILGLGFNPYRLAPDSPALAQFRDSLWALINHPKLPALYPPLTEAVFALLARLAHSVLIFKAAFVAFDVAAFLLLRAILRNTGVTAGADAAADSDPDATPAAHARIEAIYFLNPLLILEIAGRGHFDSIPIFFNVVFIWAMRTELAWAPAGLALGALAKINSLALAPVLLLRLPWKRAVAWGLGIAFLVAGAIAFSGMYELLGKFTTKFHYNGVIPFFLAKALPFLSAHGQRVALIAVAAAGTAGLFRRLRKEPLERQALGFMGLLLLCSPTLHTWYLLWVLPFAALSLSRPWLLFTGTILVTYLVYGRMHVTGEWREIAWLRLPELLPPVALWLCLKIRAARR